MAYAYNDGIIPYGSRILALSSSAGSPYNGAGAKRYIAENFETTRPVIQVKRSNEIGEPSAAVYINDWVSGTATLQLLNSGSAYPIRGDQFATPTDGTLEKFVITQVGTPESNTAEKKVSIQFNMIMN